MDVNTKFGHYLENFGNPFIVGSLVTEKTFYINRQATELFGITTENCDLGKVFDKSPERIQSMMEKALNKSKPTLVYNYTAITKENDKILVDMQVGYFNDEKTEVFLEIIPHNDKRLELALHQIQNSPRAEAILNLDENLSIVDCNEAFHQVFESSEELRHSHFKNGLVNGFLPEIRESLIADIHNTLKISDIFSTELKVFTANGEEHWYRFDLQKRELDNSGMKLMCYMVNIEKQIEVKENFDLLNQYLSVVQESTVDLLYRVDIASNTMYSYHEFQSITDGDKVIPDYVNTFFDKDTIHPDDKEIYLKGFQDFYEKDLPCEEPVRFSLGGSPYKWYKITAKKIFDNEGNLKEVFGTLVNVDNEVNMKGKVSTLHQYFDVLNEISDESLYIYDIKTDKLRLGRLTEKELGLPKEVKNFPESVIDYVHPDDLEKFKLFDGEALKSGKNSLEVRLKNVDGKYQWYELLSDIIYDEDGNQTEIFGRIKNIQSKHKLETKVEEANQELSLMNQYFAAMQSLSGESLYTIHTATKVMRVQGDITEELGLKQVHTDYPDCVIERIHPDDVESYQNFSSKTWSGLDNEVKLRARNTDGSYQWYRLTSRIIRDNKGKAIEILGIIRNIHEAETMVAEVSTLNQYVEAVQSLSGESLYYVDVKTRILRQKGEAAVELGVPDEIPNYPEGAYPVIFPEHLEKFKIFSEDTLNGKPSSIQCKVMTATGDYQWYEMISTQIYDNTGELVEIFGRMTNIECDMNFKSDFSQLNQYFSAMQDLSGDILFHIDIESMTFHHNDRNVNNFGMPYDIPDFVNTFIDKNIIHPDCHGSYRNDVNDMLSGRKMEYHVLSLTEPDVYEWYHVQGRFILNEKGKPVEVFGKMKNVQAQRNLEERAYHDMMTGALNKATFEEQGKIILDSASLDEKYALIFIDLDDFKGVNDTLGHSYGDALLTTVGKRLKRLVRGDDLVGRIGGDEFAVLLRNVDSEESVLVRTNLMLESLRRDFSFEKKVIGIKASVGVSVYPQHGTTYKDLIGKADLGVYESKRRGKNVVSMYSEELEEY